MIPGMITDKLINNGLIDREERELFIYGFDITLYTFFSTLGLLLAGSLLHRLTLSIILVFGFYALQSSGGGYHADTHTKCFFLMLAGLFTGLSYEFLSGYRILLWVIYGAGIIILCAIPLVLHPNKAYLKKETGRLIRKSYLILGALVGVSIFLAKVKLVPLSAFSALFSLAALSRIAGKIKYVQNNRR